jgi:hypothetical protein
MPHSVTWTWGRRFRLPTSLFLPAAGTFTALEIYNAQ